MAVWVSTALDIQLFESYYLCLESLVNLYDSVILIESVTQYPSLFLHFLSLLVQKYKAHHLEGN
jgi:hypothetical protein